MILAGGQYLPYGRHQIDEDDVDAVVAVLRGQPLTCGPAVTAFENAFARQVGAKYAVACANGTAGLHLAALAIGLRTGESVVVPSLTFLATASAPFFTGASVVFSDVDPETGLMSALHLESATERASSMVRAVFPVHLNGQCVDIEALSAFARRNGMHVIEDACHALGATYSDAGGVIYPVGACRHSDMTVFSLHPVKAIAMGEGGVVTTNDPALYAKLLLLRSHGMVRDPEYFSQPDEGLGPDGLPNPWYYEMPEPGLNYRASDIHCALGHSQLRKLSGFITKRAMLADCYDRLLASLVTFARPVPRVPSVRSGWHLYVVHIDFEAAGVPRGEFMRRLAVQGVGTQVHYLPVHRQPFWRKQIPGLVLPGADSYYKTCLSLPLFPAMTEDDVVMVVEAIAACMQP